MAKKIFIDYFINISDAEKRESEFARFCAYNFKNKKYNDRGFEDFCLLFPEIYLGFKYKSKLKKFLKDLEKPVDSEKDKNVSG